MLNSLHWACPVWCWFSVEFGVEHCFLRFLVFANAFVAFYFTSVFVIHFCILFGMHSALSSWHIPPFFQFLNSSIMQNCYVLRTPPPPPHSPPSHPRSPLYSVHHCAVICWNFSKHVSLCHVSVCAAILLVCLKWSSQNKQGRETDKQFLTPSQP